MTADAAIGAADALVPTFMPCGTPLSSFRKETVTGVPAAIEIVPGVNANPLALTSIADPAVGLGDAEPLCTSRSAAHRANDPDRTCTTSVRAAFIFVTAERARAAVFDSFPAAVERDAGSTAATAPGLAHVPARIVTATAADRGRAVSRSVAAPVPAVNAATVADPFDPPEPTDAFHDLSTTAAALGSTAASRSAAAPRSAAAAAGARPRPPEGVRPPAAAVSRPGRWEVRILCIGFPRARCADPRGASVPRPTSRAPGRFSPSMGPPASSPPPRPQDGPNRTGAGGASQATLRPMDETATGQAPRVGRPPDLSPDERATLLALARACVEAAAAGLPAPALAADALSPGLRAPRAAFVTLRDRHGELRGCIGHLDDTIATWENVRTAARGATVGDPRFHPVQPAEVPALVVDVNVLGDAVDLPDPADFDPVHHGVIVSRDGRRALLLPNVGPPIGWDARRTLDAVCQKAGLPADAWRRPGTRLRVFATTEFGEDDARH